MQRLLYEENLGDTIPLTAPPNEGDPNGPLSYELRPMSVRGS